ncbi:hypothetical protein [Belliella aquatica]|uniref:Outer membrane protein beta-barrel domain-containing protein n=1 Tax=Belliella aquatica TaxID=1323734 RepID=A0ABQ1LTZ1_9BACT|nr:hypothetical protein [Belliella aquatica]MCH7404559.1 hypothetical protein [Belliella aquatica]GGC29116.1 hypothetical protein GCM10010993_05040 [Belliella aquatica]
MKKVIYTLILFAFMSLGNEALAQGYNTGIGLRAGSGNGLTVKHFISQKAALEGILYTRWRGLIVGGLYEVHNDIREVQGLQWFYGGGAHLGTWNANRGNTPWGEPNRSYTVFGLDAIIGLDYKFQDAPVNLSLDYKPAFNFSGYNGWWGDEVALSIRFTF